MGQGKLCISRPDMKLHKSLLPVIQKNQRFVRDAAVVAARNLCFVREILERYNGTYFYDFDFSAFVFLEKLQEEQAQEKRHADDLMAIKKSIQTWNIFHRHMHLNLWNSVNDLYRQNLLLLNAYPSWSLHTNFSQASNAPLAKPSDNPAQLYITTKKYRDIVHNLTYGNRILPAAGRLKMEFGRQMLVYQFVKKEYERLLETDNAAAESKFLFPAYSRIRDLMRMTEGAPSAMQPGQPELSSPQSAAGGRRKFKTLPGGGVGRVLEIQPGGDRKVLEIQPGGDRRVSEIQSGGNRRVLEIQPGDSDRWDLKLWPDNDVGNDLYWMEFYRNLIQITSFQDPLNDISLDDSIFESVENGLQVLIWQENVLKEIYDSYKVDSQTEFASFVEEKSALLHVIENYKKIYPETDNYWLENLTYRVRQFDEDAWRQFCHMRSEASQVTEHLSQLRTDIKELYTAFNSTALDPSSEWNAELNAGQNTELNAGQNLRQNTGQTSGQNAASVVDENRHFYNRTELYHQAVEIIRLAGGSGMTGGEKAQGWLDGGGKAWSWLDGGEKAQDRLAGGSEVRSWLADGGKAQDWLDSGSGFDEYLDSYEELVRRRSIVAEVLNDYHRQVRTGRLVHLEEQKQFFFNRLKEYKQWRQQSPLMESALVQNPSMESVLAQNPSMQNVLTQSPAMQGAPVQSAAMQESSTKNLLFKKLCHLLNIEQEALEADAQLWDIYSIEKETVGYDRRQWDTFLQNTADIFTDVTEASPALEKNRLSVIEAIRSTKMMLRDLSKLPVSEGEASHWSNAERQALNIVKAWVSGHQNTSSDLIVLKSCERQLYDILGNAAGHDANLQSEGRFISPLRELFIQMTLQMIELTDKFSSELNEITEIQMRHRVRQMQDIVYSDVSRQLWEACGFGGEGQWIRTYISYAQQVRRLQALSEVCAQFNVCRDTYAAMETNGERHLFVSLVREYKRLHKDVGDSLIYKEQRQFLTHSSVVRQMLGIADLNELSEYAQWTDLFDESRLYFIERMNAQQWLTLESVVKNMPGTVANLPDLGKNVSHTETESPHRNFLEDRLTVSIENYIEGIRSLSQLAQSFMAESARGGFHDVEHEKSFFLGRLSEMNSQLSQDVLMDIYSSYVYLNVSSARQETSSARQETSSVRTETSSARQEASLAHRETPPVHQDASSADTVGIPDRKQIVSLDEREWRKFITDFNHIFSVLDDETIRRDAETVHFIADRQKALVYEEQMLESKISELQNEEQRQRESEKQMADPGMAIVYETLAALMQNDAMASDRHMGESRQLYKNIRLIENRVRLSRAIDTLQKIIEKQELPDEAELKSRFVDLIIRSFTEKSVESLKISLVDTNMARAYLKIHSGNLHAPLRGIFGTDASLINTVENIVNMHHIQWKTFLAELTKKADTGIYEGWSALYTQAKLLIQNENTLKDHVCSFVYNNLTRNAIKENVRMTQQLEHVKSLHKIIDSERTDISETTLRLSAINEQLKQKSYLTDIFLSYKEAKNQNILQTVQDEKNFLVQKLFMYIENSNSEAANNTGTVDDTGAVNGTRAVDDTGFVNGTGAVDETRVTDIREHLKALESKLSADDRNHESSELAATVFLEHLQKGQISKNEILMLREMNSQVWESFSQALMEMNSSVCEKELQTGMDEVMKIRRELETERIIPELLQSYGRGVKKYEIEDIQTRKEYFLRLFSDARINLADIKHIDAQTLADPILKQIFMEFPQLKLEPLEAQAMTTQQWSHFSHWAAGLAEIDSLIHRHQILSRKVELLKRQQESTDFGVGLRPAPMEPRVCLKIHSGNLHAPLRGIFGPNSVDVARYDSLIGPKSPTKCDAQLTESNFQTHSRVARGSEVAAPQSDQHVQKVEAAQELYKLSKRIINTLNMSSWQTLKPLKRGPVTGTADVRFDIPDIFANAHPAELTDMTQGANDIPFAWNGSLGRENLELLNRLYVTEVQANAPALTAFPKAVRHFALLLAADTQKRPKAPWVRPKAGNERAADNILAEIEDAAYQLQENMSEIWNNYEISNTQYADISLGNLYEYAQSIPGNRPRPVSGHEAEVLIRLAPSLTQTNVQLKAQDAQLHTIKEALTLQETQVGDLMDEQKALKKRLEEQEKNMRQQPEEDLYGRMLWKLQSDLRLERMRKGID